MNLPRKRAAVLVATVATGLALLGGAASATTPAPDVSATEIGRTSVGGKDVVVRAITIAPGADTGWHYHDGPVFGVIDEGTLTHYDATCRVDGVYGAGDTIHEPSGPGHVHIGRNEGDTPLVLDVVYVLPAGAPLSVPQDAPACDAAG